MAAAGTISAQALASLSGHVTLDPGATPAAAVTVNAYTSTGAFAGTVTTDASGAYSFLTLYSYLWSPGSATPVLFPFSADAVRNVTIRARST